MLSAYRSQIARSSGQIASRVDRFISFYHDKLMRCHLYFFRFSASPLFQIWKRFAKYGSHLDLPLKLFKQNIFKLL